LTWPSFEQYLLKPLKDPDLALCIDCQLSSGPRHSRLAALLAALSPGIAASLSLLEAVEQPAKPGI